MISDMEDDVDLYNRHRMGALRRMGRRTALFRTGER